jgi:hypothetical protein
MQVKEWVRGCSLTPKWAICQLYHCQKSLKIPKNQNPYIEEQTTQWSKEKRQKDKQRSIKLAHKTKDRVTRTTLKPGVN